MALLKGLFCLFLITSVVAKFFIISLEGKKIRFRNQRNLTNLLKLENQLLRDKDYNANHDPDLITRKMKEMEKILANSKGNDI